jgi:hypothetical protein
MSSMIVFACGVKEETKSSTFSNTKCPIAMYVALEPGVPPAMPCSTAALIQEEPNNYLTIGICLSQ